MEEKFSITEAQSNIRIGYANGFTGVLVSGIVWLFSGIITCLYSDKVAIWALLIGGTLISPITSVFNKFLKLKGHNKKNQLIKLAIENTIWMIMCIPLAYGLSIQKVEWFFQGMLMIIGGRYLTFSTLYGQKIYWFLGASLGLATVILFKLKIQSFSCLITGAIIELIFGYLIYLEYRKALKLNLLKEKNE